MVYSTFSVQTCLRIGGLGIMVNHDRLIIVIQEQLDYQNGNE